MPLNLKIVWGSGLSSARLMGLEDATTFGELKALIAGKSGIDPGRYYFSYDPNIIFYC